MSESLVKLLAGRRGHFQMESGYHSDSWYDLDRLFAQPARLQLFIAELARRLAAHRIEAVCGPMVGGARLAAEVASELGLKSFLTERFETPQATGLFPVRYLVPADQRAALRGRRVAIVDDAISAGSAVRGTLTDLRACGAEPVVMGALFVFGNAAAALAASQGLALEAIAHVDLGLWKPTECPLCQQGIPWEKVPDVSPPAGK